jgi:hypothetical protein
MSRETAERYLKEIKQTLAMPSKDAQAWAAMSNGEKSLLIRNSKLEKKLISDDGVVRCAWEKIQPEDRQKIREAAKRAAEWVYKLELI